MSRIDSVFGRLGAQGEKALVGFIEAGDPDYKKSLDIAVGMCKAGVDVLELGVPFSDPTADGPVIQEGSQRAIKSGMSLLKAIRLAADIRNEVGNDVAIVLFGYYNPIFKYGAKEFYNYCVSAGIDGVLVVDLPPEESDELTAQFGDKLDFIRLIAPTTSDARLKSICDSASGFIYMISRTGVTGSGKKIDTDYIKEKRKEISRLCELPVCVGFGISDAQDAALIAPFCDGIVIGSAFVKRIGDGASPKDMAEFVRKIKKEL